MKRMCGQAETMIRRVARKLVVHSAEQIALLYENGDVVRRYRVSTAANGLGCSADSNCTPYGKLTIAEKIAFDLREGAVLSNREPTGQI